MKNTDPDVNTLRRLLHDALFALGYRNDHVERPEITHAEFAQFQALIAEAAARGIGCSNCREWIRSLHAAKMSVHADTYCGECGAREADVSKAVRS